MSDRLAETKSDHNSLFFQNAYEDFEGEYDRMIK